MEIGNQSTKDLAEFVAKCILNPDSSQRTFGQRFNHPIWKGFYVHREYRVDKYAWEIALVGQFIDDQGIWREAREVIITSEKALRDAPKWLVNYMHRRIEQMEIDARHVVRIQNEKPPIPESYGDW